MAYTMERLELALKLFRQSIPYTRSQGHKSRYLSEFLESKYTFRSTTLGSATNGSSAWIDKDDSGDYDPKGKQAVLIPAARKRKSIMADPDHEIQRDNVKKPKAMNWLKGRQLGERKIVTLNLNFETGKALLTKLSVFPSNWPDDDTDSEISDDFPSLWSASGGSFASSSSSISSHPLSLRDQLALCSDKHKQRSNQKFPSSLNAPSEQITLGHPAARGCIGCIELVMRCPLLDDYSKYPCQTCVEEDMDCELIISPTKKRGCENCKKRKLVCSYTENDEHHLPCVHCQKLGSRCFAGRRTSRMLHSGVSSTCTSTEKPVGPTKERPVLACTPCRRAKSHCSLKWTSTGPCKRCRQNGGECTFEELEKPSRSKGKAQKDGIVVIDREKPGQKIDSSGQADAGPLVQQTPKAITKTILTAFAHPMDFCYDPPVDGSRPCHFCDDFTYGIFGLGARRVEIIDYRDGKGLTEIEGGHVGMGREPTRMCTICALDRVSVTNCAGHHICAIDELDESSFDYDAAFQSLNPAPGQTHTVMQNLWCFICPSPAFYSCCAIQTRNKYQEPIAPDSEEGFGCGLFLCKECAHAMISGLDLADTIAAAKDSLSGVRADSEFLLRDSDHFQQYRNYGNLGNI